ncbi:MAG: methionine biosynthesis protein MetW [Sphingomonadales bacterium]|nr:MAG: methionine biosynthesis protein MetW [Sphingomonadales bacterium]
MSLRADLALIADLVPHGARVLDVGCGDGALIAHLRDHKAADARGIELSMRNVADAVARGASVIQGDADADLADYPSDAFDIAILSRTLQATQRPDRVLAELLRIARRAIVSFPNFGHWRVRRGLLLNGRMPMTPALPATWYDTGNIHLCTIADFFELVASMGWRVEQARYLSNGRLRSAAFANLCADEAVFLLGRE